MIKNQNFICKLSHNALMFNNSRSNLSGGFGMFNLNFENNLVNNILGDRRLVSINYPNSQIVNFNYLSNFNNERLFNINNQAGLLALLLIRCYIIYARNIWLERNIWLIYRFLSLAFKSRV